MSEERKLEVKNCIRYVTHHPQEVDRLAVYFVDREFYVLIDVKRKRWELYASCLYNKPYKHGSLSLDCRDMPRSVKEAFAEYIKVVPQ